MLFCIWLIILQVYVSIVYCEGCGDFSFGSSHYEATFEEVTHFTDFKTWSEIKDICEQDYQLVSITTSDENDAILDFLLKNCTHGYYAIGLSRQTGTPRNTWDSWNWESGETFMNLESWDSGEPNVANDRCAAVYITTIGSYKWRDYGCDGSVGGPYGYICEKSMITTPQLSTAAGETTIQSSTSGTQSSSTNHIMISLSTTEIGETTEVQYDGISDAPITKASSGDENYDELDLIMIVLASASPVLVIVILSLFYKFRDRLICKSKKKTNQDQMVDTVESCDMYNIIILDNGKPSIGTTNTPAQGKHPGSNTIQLQLMNTSSDNSRDADTYHVIDSMSAHDREHPKDYESGVNLNYENYQVEETGPIYIEITNETEDRVDNPVYERCLPN